METIFVPTHGSSEFFNYKKYHSVVLLTLVDGNKKLICVDVEQYGKASDGNMFSNSNIGKRLTRLNFRLHPDENLGNACLPYVLVGDKAFPLKQYLMRPYPSNARRLNEAEKIFNYILLRSRNTVENVFCILANTRP